MPPLDPCPLCLSPLATPFAAVQGRNYLHCGRCGLVFMAEMHRPSPEQELAHYRLHQNDPADARYRAFLSRLSRPLVPHLPPGAQGLDYGCGPGPTLSVMLREQGFVMSDCDPFFAADAEALRRTYDFITCTETIEHFHRPAEEFARLDRLLRPGGWLGVMTQMLTDPERFVTWRYVLDPTHVCFYGEQTMRWIAGRHEWTLLRPAPGVALFRKGGTVGEAARSG
jgi:SAM-dependent methyltransferase